MNEQMREPSEEELRAALEEQMRSIQVEDVVLQTVATLVNLAGRRLGLAGDGQKDLEQAKLAIDSARALIPFTPEDQLEPIKQAMAQLQMAFAQEAQQPEAASRPEQSAGHGPQSAEGGPDEEDERAKARSKIWTPPGT